jgi:hypothetical protein
LSAFPRRLFSVSFCFVTFSKACIRLGTFGCAVSSQQNGPSQQPPPPSLNNPKPKTKKTNETQ